MNCPYCLSDISEDAVVCKVCTKDVYLFRPMMAKVADLEKQLAEIPNQEAYEKRISELERMLDESESKSTEPKSLLANIEDVALYILVPLTLLLLTHWLVVVVYDASMIYLRIVSMVLPLPFAYYLFRDHQRKLLPWFIGVAFLSITSVIGMSWITSMVDQSPIFPQGLFEWRETVEYAASIAFSFLTGMLLGGVSYANKQRYRRAARVSPFMKAVAMGLEEGNLSPNNIYTILKTLQEYGATVVALGTTALSIYTGLKGIIGS